MDNDLKTDFGHYIGYRIVDDLEKLKLFALDCFVRVPVNWSGHKYDIVIVYKGKTDVVD